MRIVQLEADVMNGGKVSEHKMTDTTKCLVKNFYIFLFFISFSISVSAVASATLQITVQSPAENQVFADTNMVWFNVTTSDENGIDSVWLDTGELLTNSSGDWHLLNEYSLAGPYGHTIYANDTYGNINSIYVSFFVSAVTQCQEVSVAGNYEVINNISPTNYENCFFFSGDNIYLNGNGHSIAEWIGNDEDNVLIYFQGSNYGNLTLNNFTITSLEGGQIFDFDSFSVSITNNLIKTTRSGNNDYPTIWLRGVDNLLFENNTVISEGFGGDLSQNLYDRFPAIQIYQTNNAIIRNNIIRVGIRSEMDMPEDVGFGVGIYAEEYWLGRNDYLTIENNTIYSNMRGVMMGDIQGENQNWKIIGNNIIINASSLPSGVYSQTAEGIYFVNNYATGEYHQVYDNKITFTDMTKSALDGGEIYFDGQSLESGITLAGTYFGAVGLFFSGANQELDIQNNTINFTNAGYTDNYPSYMGMYFSNEVSDVLPLSGSLVDIDVLDNPNGAYGFYLDSGYLSVLGGPLTYVKTGEKSSFGFSSDTGQFYYSNISEASVVLETFTPDNSGIERTIINWTLDHISWYERPLDSLTVSYTLNYLLPNTTYYMYIQSEIYDGNLTHIATQATDANGLLPTYTWDTYNRVDKFIYTTTELGLTPVTNNTITGTNVFVELSNHSTNITFDNVLVEGTTSINVSVEGPILPSGFNLSVNYYDISTTAIYTGDITVCIKYNDLEIADESNLRLLHYENDAWTDVTTSLDTAGDVICGTVSSLSPFVIGYYPTPPNQPPVANAGGPYVGTEGSAITLEASESYDMDNDVLSYRWDFDNDGIWDTTWLTNPEVNHTWNDDTNSMVKLEVSDGKISDIASTNVIVNNVAPAIVSIVASQEPVLENTSVTARANFTDSGVLDTHTAVWNWGDSNTSIGTITEASGLGSIEGTHNYTAQGVYTITLTLYDNDGDSIQSVFQYVVVYDPEGGFVTGGGWITSPIGAYQPDTSLTGNANFGFVSKYQKGANIPTGQTEFQFKVANMNFHSTSYDWLVISGPKAKYKGEGTINNNGNYGFLLTATDGQLNGGQDTDKFRIKIWEMATGQIVYDNQMGASDDADTITAIERGDIRIHKQ